MSSTSPDVSRRLLAARIFAVIALCMVPVSTAGTNIACGLFAVALILSPEFWRSLPTLIQNRAALAALLLLVSLVASVAYSVAPGHEAWNWLAKYRKLLLLPFAVIAFRGSNWAGIARWSLFITLCVVLVLSTTNYLGLTAIGPARLPDPVTRAWVFKNHIAAGMFGALLFYMAADLALTAQTTAARLAFAAISALSLVNIFVMLQGRTGAITAIPLALLVVMRYIWAQRSKSPARAAAIAATIVVAGAVLVGIGVHKNNSRLLEVTSEVQQYEQSHASTSTGVRLEWYRKCIELIRERPLLGYGVGGLGTEFDKLTNGETNAAGFKTSNPHNEYLLLTVQAGAIGLVLFLNLLIQVALGSRSLDERSRNLLLGWFIIFVMGCLANSLLLDFAEGHLFVLLSGILLGCGDRSASRSRPVTVAQMA